MEVDTTLSQLEAAELNDSTASGKVRGPLSKPHADAATDLCQLIRLPFCCPSLGLLGHVPRGEAQNRGAVAV